VRIAEPSGEIQIRRNPAMLLGYQNDPERTAAAFDGDWFRTGDLGRLHADGSVEFVARRSDLIRRKGEHVDPREVEEVLAGHRDVAHAVVVAVPVSACDDAIEAYVVPATARRPHLADLRAWCARYLAAFKRPRGITVVDRMPMTATSKVDRLTLRRQSIGVLE
jgi:acyl-CoA synthetase (AMP-forming)/AMP-acid ligase II